MLRRNWRCGRRRNRCGRCRRSHNRRRLLRHCIGKRSDETHVTNGRNFHGLIGHPIHANIQRALGDGDGACFGKASAGVKITFSIADRRSF